MQIIEIKPSELTRESWRPPGLLSANSRFILDSPPFMLVMELLDKPLTHWIRKARKPELAKRLGFTVDAISVVEYIDGRNVVHDDIAARNCLLQGERLKLADFGLSTQSPPGDINTNEGPIRYLAPEVLASGKITRASDLYAFGLLLWETYSNPLRKPYHDLNALEVVQRVPAGCRPEIPPLMPDEVRKVVSALWDEAPRKRESASKIKKMLQQLQRSL